MKKVLSVLLASLLLLFCLAGCTSAPTNDITELKTADTTLDSKITELKTANTALDSKITELKTAAQTLETKVQELETKAQTLESSLSQINTQIESLKQTNNATALEETKTALETEINALKGAVETVKNSISTIRAEITAEIDTEVAGTAAEIGQISATIDVKIAQIKSDINRITAMLKDDAASTEEAIKALSNAVTALQTQADKNAEDITDLKEKIETLETEKDNLQSKLDENDEDIASLLEKLEALEAEKNAMQGYLSCLLSGTHSLNYSDNEDGTHTEACDTCGYAVISDHSVGYTDNGDGTHTGVCDTCGYEVISNHSVGYTDNGDGTHTEACDACDYEIISEHSYTFTPDEEMHGMIIALCACNDKHQLDYSCACYSCEKFFHNLDENCYCSNCWDYIHNVDPTTGICNRCNEFTAEASVTVDGTKTYYSMVNYALLAAVANPDSLVVLENDATVRNYNDDFDNGSFTLDLNGKVFNANSNYALNETNTNIIIKDSVGGGSFANGKTVTSSGTITIESGYLSTAFPSSGGKLIVKGGRVDSVHINVKTATLTLAGGSFGTVTTYADYYSLADLLEEGYCYYDEDGNVVDIDSISADGYWYKINNVTVAPIK